MNEQQMIQFRFAVDQYPFQYKLQDTMLEDLNTEQIQKIFDEIDTNKDGFITRQDLQATAYAISLFQQTPSSLNAFNCFTDTKINKKDFVLLVHGSRFRLQDIAISKFQFEKYVNAYLSESAPGQAAPSVKQSYLRLTAHTNAGENDKLHSLGYEMGVDKPHQEAKIKQITQAIGHKPHQVFLLLKFKTTKNGQEIATKLHELIQNLIDIVKGLAPELENSLTALKAYSKYANNYVYLIVEVDNPFVDGLIDFATEVIQTLSPQCALKLKANISSNLTHLLTQDFDYSKSGGQVLIEFDIDHVTMKKLKKIIGGQINEAESTPFKQLAILLFQQVKLSAQFSNLGEALTSALHIDINQLPKIHNHVAGVKELGLKETVGQFHQGGPALIDLINQSSEAQGEFSINLHDIFIKINYDVNITNAFELLG